MACNRVGVLACDEWCWALPLTTSACLPADTESRSLAHARRTFEVVYACIQAISRHIYQPFLETACGCAWVWRGLTWAGTLR